MSDGYIQPTFQSEQVMVCSADRDYFECQVNRLIEDGWRVVPSTVVVAMTSFNHHQYERWGAVLERCSQSK